MDIRPILFNTEMVRAILTGRKTVTRRVVKGYALDHLELDTDGSIIGVYNQDEGRVFPVMDYAPCRPGDIMYVRETFWQSPNGEYTYKSDYNQAEHLTWHPSIHMPREAARIFLRVTGVRVERLQEITELDILEKEGLTVDFPQPKPSYMSLAYTETKLKPAVRNAFSDLWNSTVKPEGRAVYGWDANPWVWVIEFDRCERPET